MKVLAEVVGEAGAIGAEEVVEPSADPLQSLVLNVGGAGDGRRASDGVALTGNVDLEIDGRARRIVAESAQEHSGRGDVFSLAESAQGALLEMDDDSGRGPDGNPGRHRRQIGDGGFEELFDVAGGDGAVDSNSDSNEGFGGLKVIGLGEQHDATALAG